jgi:hypothetical protein
MGETMPFPRERRRCKGDIVVGCLGCLGVVALVFIVLVVIGLLLLLPRGPGGTWPLGPGSVPLLITGPRTISDPAALDEAAP